MDTKMKMANLLATNIKELIELVRKNENDKDNSILNHDKIYQVSLFIKEYKFAVTADEIKRINTFSWNEKYTLWLVRDFYKGLAVIDDYIKRNYEDLFFVSARIYTLQNLSEYLLNQGGDTYHLLVSSFTTN